VELCIFRKTTVFNVQFALIAACFQTMVTFASDEDCTYSPPTITYHIPFEFNSKTMNTRIQEIWIDLYQELRKFISGKVNDINTTEDILQDVFLKIQLNIHTLTDCSKLTAWVYQITRNTIADHYRKTINSEVQIDGFDLAEQDNEEPLYHSLSNCINQKINKLSDKYKEAILLTYLNAYSQIELAEKLNISYSGAKTRVQRGREQLKDFILDCPNVETDSKGNLIAYEPPKE
jgi:RNA polymerase sigma-70 factor (ECF subfamily)